MKTVILQPMFLPWVGVFEQIRLADVYVHLDDVSFSAGSFVNRIQIKTNNGIRWLTVPIYKKNKQLIKDVKIDTSKNWKIKHLKTLQQEYKKAPFFDEMLSMAELIYNYKTDWLSELNIFALESISEYFKLETTFKTSSDYCITQMSSQKVLEIIKLLNSKYYITGHGAKNYLDHILFEEHDIRVEYMDYLRKPYPQLHGEFDPHVSILDLIANTGRNGFQYITSTTKYWKDFLNE